MTTIEEKRVYTDSTDQQLLVMATGIGVASALLAGTRIGEFGLVTRCDARDLAVGDEAVYVATADAVLRGRATGAVSSPDALSFDSVGHGPAVAIGVLEGIPIAAAGDGTLSRRTATGRWESVGQAPAVTAIDGPLVGTADGVYRITDSAQTVARMTLAGQRIHDVTHHVPLVATAGGVYRLTSQSSTAADSILSTAVAAIDATEARDGDVMYAVGADHLWSAQAGFDPDWTVRELPTTAPAVDVLGPTVQRPAIVVSEQGTVVVETSNGWETVHTGLAGTAAVAGLQTP